MLGEVGAHHFRSVCLSNIQKLLSDLTCVEGQMEAVSV